MSLACSESGCIAGRSTLQHASRAPHRSCALTSALPRPPRAGELRSLHEQLALLAEAAGSPLLLQGSTAAIATAQLHAESQRTLLAQGAQVLGAVCGLGERGAQQQEQVLGRLAAMEAAAAQGRADAAAHRAEQRAAAQAAEQKEEEVTREVEAVLDEVAQAVASTLEARRRARKLLLRVQQGSQAAAMLERVALPLPLRCQRCPAAAFQRQPAHPASTRQRWTR